MHEIKTQSNIVNERHKCHQNSERVVTNQSNSPPSIQQFSNMHKNKTQSKQEGEEHNYHQNSLRAAMN